METKITYWTIIATNGDLENYNSKEYDMQDFNSNLRKVPCIIFVNKFKKQKIYYPICNIRSLEVEER